MGQVRYITVWNARLATAERLANGVFLALAQTLSADEFAEVQAQLSKDFAWLLPRESGRRDPPLEVLLDRVADPAGAPVLRDQGPIGRPGTARPIQAVTLYMAIDGAAAPSRLVAADELQIWSAAEHPD